MRNISVVGDESETTLTTHRKTIPYLYFFIGLYVFSCVSPWQFLHAFVAAGLMPRGYKQYATLHLIPV